MIVLLYSTSRVINSEWMYAYRQLFALIVSKMIPSIGSICNTSCDTYSTWCSTWKRPRRAQIARGKARRNHEGWGGTRRVSLAWRIICTNAPSPLAISTQTYSQRMWYYCGTVPCWCLQWQCRACICTVLFLVWLHRRYVIWWMVQSIMYGTARTAVILSLNNSIGTNNGCASSVT